MRDRARGAHHAFDFLERGVEIQARDGLQQLEATSRATGATVVVAFTELVGVLKPVRAAAEWAGLVALLENVFANAQAAQDFGPATMGSAFDVFNASFVLGVVHDELRVDDMLSRG